MNIELVYKDIDKYIEKIIKMYEDKVNTNFQGKKCLKKMLHMIVCH